MARAARTLGTVKFRLYGIGKRMRPGGTRRLLFSFPGTKVPGYVQSFLRNEPKPTFAEASSKAWRIWGTGSQDVALDRLFAFS